MYVGYEKGFNSYTLLEAIHEESGSRHKQPVVTWCKTDRIFEPSYLASYDRHIH